MIRPSSSRSPCDIAVTDSSTMPGCGVASTGASTLAASSSRLPAICATSLSAGSSAAVKPGALMSPPSAETGACRGTRGGRRKTTVTTTASAAAVVQTTTAEPTRPGIPRLNAAVHRGRGTVSFATASRTRDDRWAQKRGDGSGTCTRAVSAMTSRSAASSRRQRSHDERCGVADSGRVPSARSMRFGLREMPHVHGRSSPSSFRRLPSAWKKLALTAPTELPSIDAISWCESS